MGLTDLVIAPIPIEQIEANLDHVVCCVDESKTFCGLFNTEPVGMSWTFDEVTCPICASEVERATCGLTIPPYLCMCPINNKPCHLNEQQ